MNMKNMCEKKCCGMSWCMCGNRDVGLLVLRLTTGIIFLVMGISKLQGMDATIGFFASVGIPAFLAWIVAFLETIGGACLVLGFMTRVFAKILALIVLFAMLIVHSHGPFMGLAMPLAVFGSAFALSCFGGGKYSLSRLCSCGGKCMVCKSEKGCCSGMKCDGCTEKCAGGVCSKHEAKESAPCCSSEHGTVTGDDKKEVCAVCNAGTGTCDMHTEK